MTYDKWIGEWWKSDVEAVINEALKSGLAPNVSDAHTINGYPGPVRSCNSQGDEILSKIHNHILMSLQLHHIYMHINIYIVYVMQNCLICM